MIAMAKKRQNQASVEGEGRVWNVRLPLELRAQVEKLAQRNLSNRTAEVVAAVLRHLESHGLRKPPRFEDS